MPDIDEGLDFASAFGATFGSLERARQRMKSERAATKTAAQRARSAKRIVQVNFRTEPAIKELAEQLARHLDTSIALVIDRALVELAKANGIDPS